MPRERPKGFELKRNRSGNWEIYGYDENEERVRVSTGTDDYTVASQILVDYEASLDRRQGLLTVGDLLDHYEKDRAGKVQAYSRIVEALKPLREGLGVYRPDQLKRRWSVYAANRKVSPGTLGRERNALVAALNLGKRDGMLAEVPYIPTVQAPPPRDRYLTKTEARRLLIATKGQPHLTLFVMLGLMTGARKSAILGLTWDRVDLDRGIIDYRDPMIPATKKRRAIVPFGKKLAAQLKMARECARTDHVIEWGGKPVTAIRRSWGSACRRAGLGKEVTPHVMRHTAASWLAMAAVSLDQASDLLACDPRTLRTVYRKFDPAYLRTAASTLERLGDIQ